MIDLIQIGRALYAFIIGFMPAVFFVEGYIYALRKESLPGYLWTFLIILAFVLYPLSFLLKAIVDMFVEHKKRF